MSDSRNTIIYKSKIKCSTDNIEAGFKSLEEAIKNAPTPSDFPKNKVEVCHSITVADIVIDEKSIAALLAQYGLLPSPQNNQANNANLAEKPATFHVKANI